MSYEMEKLVQAQDDEEEAYHHWFQSTPQYWCTLTDEKKALVISSLGLKRCSASGVIDTKENTK